MPLHYQNPVIHADYADPDVIRVENNFWMVSSSFNQLPALPILHSRDLIHWRIVNHAVKRLPSPEYDAVQHGKGVWAPSIRYHDGQFWIFYSLPDDGIFVTHTRDPLGEWSTPRCLKKAPGWIDPCPFWDDDGRAWLVHAFAYSRCGIKNKLQLIEMATDASRLLDDGRIIFDGTPSHPTLEGPKLYKHANEYWIFAPAGGVKRGWQTVLRAAQLSGPWQHRDVLHQGNTAINGPHQGAWVALENGEHWFFHFQDKGVYGRVVHLQPLRWQEDGWPAIGEPLGNAGKGQPVIFHPRPSLPVMPCSPQTSDDFPEGKPGLQWQWQANPQSQWLEASTAGLALRCAPHTGSLYTLPQMLLQKFPAERFVVTLSLENRFSQLGDEAGLIIYGERFAALCLVREASGVRLLLRHGWNSDRGELSESVLPICDDMSGNPELGFHVDYDGISRFCYRVAGEAWREVTPGFSAGAGKWVGARFGLYASGQGSETQGMALFSHVVVREA